MKLIFVWTLSASGALGLCLHAFGGGGDSEGRGGDLPCYFEPTIVYGPSCGGDGDSFHPMFPRAINSTGQVAGEYFPCLGGGDTAFAWTAEQGVMAIPMPPQTADSNAVDITETRDLNELGQLCGTLSILDDGTGPRGFIYDAGALTLLQPLAGDPSSYARAISLNGTVVGFSTGNQHLAVYWESSKAWQIPGLLGPYSQAVDINDLGEITGWMGNGPASPFGGSHAFLWQDGTVTELAIPDGALALDTEAISNAQEIVGRVVYLDPKSVFIFRPFTWSDGVTTELPLLPGYTDGTAQGVSDTGLIVGVCSGRPGDNKAVLWHNGIVYDLYEMMSPNEDISELSFTSAVNNDGIIAAQGEVGPEDDDHSAMIVLTPVYPRIGDLNCDKVVNSLDLANLLSQWGPGDNLSADFDDDGFVDAFDLAQLLANWGS